LFNQRSRKGLAPQTADVCAFRRADLYRVQAWRLAANRVHARRGDFDVLAVADQPTKKPFGDRTPTNVACADEKDVFHGSERAANAFTKLKANLPKSMCLRSVVFSMICRFSQPGIVVIVTIVPSLSSK
jgi:hypothetical protein